MTNDSPATPRPRAAATLLHRTRRALVPATPTGVAGRAALVLGTSAALAAVALAGAAGQGGATATRPVAASSGSTGGSWLAAPLVGSSSASGSTSLPRRSVTAGPAGTGSATSPTGGGGASSAPGTGGGSAAGGVAPSGAPPGPGTTPAAGVVTAGTMKVGGDGSCGGQSTVVSDGITWACSFDSEFTGSSLDRAQWQPITTAASGYLSGPNACYVDNPANISVGNGYLSLTARKEAAPFACQLPGGMSFTTQYTSATVATYQLFSQAYGRFEVIAKVPSTAVPGLQSSFWLYPESLDGYGPWPASGEIDIAEVYSQYAWLGVPFLHYYTDGYTSAATDTNVVTNDSCTIAVGQFNDYVLEWTPTTMRLVYNGTTCLVDHWVPALPLSAPAPFDQPFFVNLTQALGVGTNQFDPSTTPLPATTEVKAVRVWRDASAS